MIAATDNSKTRPLRLKSNWGDAPVLVDVRGTEAISEPYRFDLSFVAESDNLKFSELLGTSATVYVDLPSGESRKWNGVITSLHQAGRDEEFCHYTATLEPSFALLGLQSNYRIFQDASIESIIREVCGDLSLDISLTKTHRDRNYCVQYGETDLAFVSRVMEEEGIFYLFSHEDDSHKLLIRDDSTQLNDFDALESVPYTKLKGGVQDEACIQTWEKTQRLVTTSVSLRDSHFQDAGETFETEQSIGKDVKRTYGTVEHPINADESTRQVAQYPAQCVVWADDVGADLSVRQQVADIPDAAKELAQRRTTAIQNSAFDIQSSSNQLLLVVGGKFTLDGHFNADGTYLVTRLEHKIDLGIGKQSSPSDSPLKYANSFSCLPSSVPFVPTAGFRKPIVTGVQSAFVVAETEEDQLYDKYGRVKVWFPWDRREGPTLKPLDADDSDAQDQDSAADEKDSAKIKASQRSCWLRVAQVWAGPRWGAYFWPRAGHEVLVAFEHGDPERPIVVGSVYNSRNMPPLDMPDQAHVGGIRSSSVKGNPASNFNGISFHDELKNEHLELHSESHAVLISEESNHSFVRGTSVRVFGTMYSTLSSGGGGGPAAEAEAPPADETEKKEEQPAGQLINSLGQKWDKTKGWSKKWLAASFEADIAVTLGHAASVVGGFPLGTVSEVVQGGKLGFILDPSGWIADDTVQQLQDLIIPMGDTSGLFGSRRTLHYGPSTTIRHGSEIVRRSSDAFDASNPRTAWVAGIASVSTALTLLGWRLQKDDPTAWENLVRALGPRGASGVLFNLLVEYEKACGECDAGEETQNEASSLTSQADSLDADYQSLILDLASAFTERGTALSSTGEADTATANSDASAVGDTSSFVDSTEDEGEEGDESGDEQSSDSSGPSDDDDGTVSTDDVSFGPDEANVYESYDGLLSTSARHLSFRARSTDEEDTDASLIHLDAQGGEGNDNGVVAINSTGQATMVCGPASLQIRRSSDVGQVSVRTGDQGSIQLVSGPSDSGSNASLDPNTLKLNIGGDSGSTISMTAEGIKLSFGGGPGASIELNSSGITMECGSSKFVLAAAEQSTSAESITHTASASLNQKGAMIDIEASASATLKGAMTMIN
ncbi:type VI secretion system Vgr family protein [Aeoliella mucimassa]|uniref:Phage-related baseplate assembly protein n=1 Tax=Aeoliella mucimassa TaxID=2527972 RepID=A0A518AUG2_9BACT|nr:type VI secretion system tip protein TssI/VgrG [Aeoliella mucimassa]QDU58368.1 Phage-related baseplate assembly protein [Aeoliella mucimassa]